LLSLASTQYMYSLPSLLHFRNRSSQLRMAAVRSDRRIQPVISIITSGASIPFANFFLSSRCFRRPKRTKSLGARSGEYGWCETVVKKNFESQLAVPLSDEDARYACARLFTSLSIERTFSAECKVFALKSNLTEKFAHGKSLGLMKSICGPTERSHHLRRIHHFLRWYWSGLPIFNPNSFMICSEIEPTFAAGNNIVTSVLLYSVCSE
jgi:hypothetical protein